MIRARIYKAGAALGLEIEGHAGSGAPGQDLVCAAVSTLAFAFESLLEKMEREERLIQRQPPHVEKGRASLKAHPTGQSAAVLEGAVELAGCFLALLKENYPENIDFCDNFTMETEK